MEQECEKINWLKRIFEEKKQRNPSFSLRAFARYLEISPGYLSKLFNGKKRITLETFAKVENKIRGIERN